MDTAKQIAIIIGAGPAGLTAAYELLKRTNVTPIILEKSGDIGGISKTVNYKGNRIDIGGHRFLSKSDRVMQWWLNIIPLSTQTAKLYKVPYQRTTPEDAEKVMLVRKRLSRIYFLGRFFAYPISLTIDTLRKLGVIRTITILLSFFRAHIFPRKKEKTLEDFMINRFGKVLYRLFFKDYTEKIWGVPCTQIPAEWGAQRIKGVSILKAIEHAIQEEERKKNYAEDIAQKDIEPSLIERFFYPKYGPGQLWEEVARQIQEMGGIIHLHQNVQNIYIDDNRVTAVKSVNSQTGETLHLNGDYFFSTMPVKELIAGINGPVPDHVKAIAAGLQYRDFITVGILLRKLSYLERRTGEWKSMQLQDTWIYIQEKEVNAGRLQLFNNWSPYMVKDPDTVWVGVEFFCNTTDAFWKKTDTEIATLAIQELEKIGLASAANVLDSTVVRMEKTYPAYFGAYADFDQVKAYTDQLENLFLIGRNGMHKYNNADHSMLTAMVAVDNISLGITTKENIWAIEAIEDPQEEKAPASVAATLKEFIFENIWNRALVWLAAALVIFQFIVFKIHYPSAGFIDGDSYVYLESAQGNLNINTYPVGYSKFLRIFSAFTTSDTVLVAFQYLLLQVTSLLLVFTIAYLYKPSRAVFGLLFICAVLNPVFLYMANYVSSDALFLGLSLAWFTSLLWIVYKPSGQLIATHAILILLAFTVRYNALFYPVVAVFGFLLSRLSWRMKLVGIASGFILIAGFIYHTSNQYNRLTGVRQFSPFSGWQLANNALYAYRYVQDEPAPEVPEKFKELDGMVRRYFDTSKNIVMHPQEGLLASTWYMWAPESPLQTYMRKQFAKDSTAPILKKWASMGPLFKDYGTWLLKRYPLKFAQYYLAPNLIKYYTPPVEFLDAYNMGKDSISRQGLTWFNYNSPKLKTYYKDLKVTALDFYPIAVGIFNIIFLFSLIGFFMLRGFKAYKQLSGILVLIGVLWLVNLAFSVFASQIALRFQMLPILVCCFFSLLLVDNIWKAAFSKN